MTRPWTYVVLVLALLFGSGAHALPHLETAETEASLTRGSRAMVKVTTRVATVDCPRTHSRIGPFTLPAPAVVAVEPVRAFSIVATLPHAHARSTSLSRTHGARAPPLA